MNHVYALNPEQFASVIALPGEDRYRHFVSRVADWQWVWGLRGDGGWISASVGRGKAAFPVWPHPDYAAACADGAWSGSKPASVEIHEFVDRWLSGMARDAVPVAVFPTARMKGIVVAAAVLQQALREELSRIE